MNELTSRIKSLWRAAFGSTQGRGGISAVIQTLIARFLIIGVNVVTGTITARILGPSGRGEQAAIAVWPQFFAYSLSLGLPSALLYSLKRYPENRSESFSAAIVLSSAMSVFGALLGVFTIPLLLKKYSPEVVELSQWLMWAVPLAMVTEILRAAMEASDEFAIANQIRYIPPIGTLVLLTGLALTGEMAPFTAAISYWIPIVPVIAWMLMRSRRFFQIRLHALEHAIKRLLHYGLRAYGIDLITTLAGQIQQVIAVSLLVPASMGLYAIAYSLCQVLYVVQGSVVSVLFPKAAARPVSEVVALTGRAARIGGLLALISAIALMTLAPIVLKLLYGSEYLAAVSMFRLLAIETVLSGTSIILSQTFMALDRPGMVTIVQSFGLILGIPLMLLLTPKYGLIGLGFALLCTTTVRLVFVLTCYPLVLKTSIPNLLPRYEDIEFLKQNLVKKG